MCLQHMRMSTWPLLSKTFLLRAKARKSSHTCAVYSPLDISPLLHHVSGDAKPQLLTQAIVIFHFVGISLGSLDIDLGSMVSRRKKHRKEMSERDRGKRVPGSDSAETRKTRKSY